MRPQIFGILSFRTLKAFAKLDLAFERLKISESLRYIPFSSGGVYAKYVLGEFRREAHERSVPALLCWLLGVHYHRWCYVAKCSYTLKHHFILRCLLLYDYQLSLLSPSTNHSIQLISKFCQHCFFREKLPARTRQ